ncbi:hypothetical protein CDD83_315 [Cordyceps sp. RAO-2017]|nr:hypothetical protein CDD83_315 [Cordyceps sp. RAO-2017]
MAEIKTRYGEAVPPAPRHSVTVHMPGFETAEKFGSDPASVVSTFKNVYPRMKPHRDIERLARAVLECAGATDRACLLFSSMQSAKECVEYATSSRRNDGKGKEPVPPDQIEIRAFAAKNSFYAVIFPPDKRPVVAGFWATPGCGVSSRFAEANLNHLDRLAEVDVGEDGGDRLDFDGPTHQLLRERIVSYLERAPANTQPKPMPSPADVYFFPTGMASIYKPHSYLLNLHQGATVLFGMAFMNTITAFEDFGSSFKFLGLGTDQDLQDLEAFLDDQRRQGQKVQAIWTEFPANPLLVTPDLDKLRSLADEYDIILIVDDTIGSWANVDVIAKADMLVTSLTKSFNGYADVIAGSVVLNPSSNKHQELKTLFDSNYVPELYVHDIEAIERNSRDYLSRTARLNSNAESLVQYLASRAEDPNCALRRVYHPSVNASRKYYQRFMRSATPELDPGFGCLLSVELASLSAARAFFDNLNVHKGPHLGAPFTLAFAYIMCGYKSRLEWAAKYGLKPTQIRISAGLEDPATLREIFGAAVDAANKALEDRGLHSEV